MMTDDALDLLGRVRVFVCWEHRLVVKVLGSGATTRGTPGHRRAGCAECDQAIADAFACLDDGSRVAPCEACDGEGEWLRYEGEGDAHTVPCDMCNGTGREGTA